MLDKYSFCGLILINDENIGFDKYINNSILHVYKKNIIGYFDTKYRYNKN